MTATGGKIGGWTINSTSLTKKTADTGGYTIGINAPSTVTPSVNRAFYVDDDTAGTSDPNPFYVRYDGFLHAGNADITGTMTASGGFIGGWTINTNSLSK
jgi:hypothetical protein